MEFQKCECGHVNPYGTVLCEACGKPLVEMDKPFLDMRYEGTARRSQVYQKSLIDKVWQFFSSVKTGIYLIVITLVAAAIGTILPQEDYIPNAAPANEFYQKTYGTFGEIYYRLGLHHLYSSWWFILILGLLGTSLVICSLDRIIPLARALRTQRVTRHDSFLHKQRLFSKTTNVAEDNQLIIEKLQKKHYQVRQEDGNFFAEKGRFSRWGPYVNHVGLIIFLLGCMIRTIPGVNITEHMAVKTGSTVAISGTNQQYFLKNNGFSINFYDKKKDKKQYKEAIKNHGSIVKSYQTKATLYQKDENGLRKLKDYTIEVNKPLKFDGYGLYQSSFTDSGMKAMTFDLVDSATLQSHGTITIDLKNPQQQYVLSSGYRVNLLRYYPDFYFDKNGLPASKSTTANNPAFVFKMYSPKLPNGEVSFVAIKETVEADKNNTLAMKFSSVTPDQVPILTVRKDSSIWILVIGGIIFMLGVVQGSYWQHRRIWLKRTVERDVLFAAHTNKNWYGFQKEIASVLAGSSILPPIDTLKNREEQENGTAKQ